MSARPRTCQGYTVLEAAVGASILGFLLLAGVQVSGSAVDSLRTTSAASEDDQELQRSSSSLLTELLSAGRSTLQGIPYGGIAEPMLEDVPYSHLQFRRSVAYSGTNPIYSPPAGVAPFAIWLELEGAEVVQGIPLGHIALFDGKSIRVVARGVAGLTFTRHGSALEIHVLRPGHDPQELQDQELSLLLRSQ
jgi:hypothetical protein